MLVLDETRRQERGELDRGKTFGTWSCSCAEFQPPRIVVQLFEKGIPDKPTKFQPKRYVVEIVPARPDKPVRARASVTYLACSTICIPIDAKLTLDLNSGANVPTAHTEAINEALTRVPSLNVGDLSVESVIASGSEEEPLLNVSIRSEDAPIVDPDVLIEYSDEIRFSRPNVRLSSDRREATLTVGVQNFMGDPVAEHLSGKTVTITIMDGARAVEAVRRIQ